MNEEKNAAGAQVPCIDLLAQKAERARETLTQTEGGCGSGTVACRLWHELYGLVREIEKANPPAHLPGETTGENDGTDH